MSKNDFKILDDREHILQRPSMYVGSISSEEQTDFNLIDEKISYHTVNVVPGLLKIINEIIDNSVDEAIKTKFEYANEISIDIDSTQVTVQDNGRGIPVVKHPEGYQPYLCWGRAKAGSNFNDDENHTQIGMNGVGSFLTAVYSKQFIGETSDGSQYYKVIFNDNASNYKEQVKKSNIRGTTVTFIPDLERFNLQEITEDHINTIHQRILCLANTFTDIKFKFNKKLIKVKKFNDFVSLFNENNVVYDEENVKIGLIPNDTDDFKSFTYVNGLKMKDGGIHVDVIINQVINIIRDKLTRKYKNLKPGDIKNKLTLIAFIKNFPNPKFNSQTKEKLTNSQKEFNEFAQIDYKFVDKLLKNPNFVDPIIEVYKIKEEFENRKALKSVEKTKKIKSDKYFRGTGSRKYLVLCEGFSAFGGISKVLGNKDYDYYCLKGKILNTWEISHQKFAANQEVSELYNIIKTEDFEKIIIGTDKDLDGAHIASLIAAFFEKYLPEHKHKLCRLDTPIKMTKKNNKPVRWTYDINEELEQQPGEISTYYKGLGTWSADDLDYVIKHDTLEKMIVSFDFDSDEIIDDFMSDKKSDTRKEYILKNNFNIAKI